MASTRAHGQLILQNENLGIPHKGPAVVGRTKSSKEATKKGGGLGNRKALIDITNSSRLRQEASSKKKTHLKEEFNIAEEKFLHDHRKCIEAQTAAKDQNLLDTFLVDIGSVSPARSLGSEKAEAGFESPPRNFELEPLPELPEPAFPSWLESPIQWASPPASPLRFEPLEFVLKPDADD